MKKNEQEDQDPVMQLALKRKISILGDDFVDEEKVERHTSLYHDVSPMTTLLTE
jgi:hypothetical protein